VAGTFVRLKLAILRNQLRSPRLRAAGLAGLLTAVLFAWGGLLILFGVQYQPGVDETVLVFGAALIGGGWVALPLLLFTIDDTLDPGRLATFPLPVRQLLGGQLAAGLVGMAPASVLVASLGTLFFAVDAVSFALISVAIALLALLGVTGSRALTNLLSERLRSRQGGDVAMLLGTLALGGLAAGLQLAGPALRDPRTFPDSTAYDVLSWTPGGALGRAVVEAGDGLVAKPALRLAYVALVVVAFVAVWWFALERLLRDQGGSARRRKRAPQDLFGRILSFLPRDRVGAVTAREVRQRWGEPRRKSNLMAAAIIPIVVISLGSGWSGSRNIEVFAAFSPALLIVTETANGFGNLGPALWMDVAAAGRLHDDVRAAAWAGVLLSVAPMVAAGLVLALVGGGWAYLPAALVAAAGASAIAHALASMTSVIAPVPVNVGKNVYAQAGSAAATVLPVLATMAVTAAALLPLYGLVFLSGMVAGAPGTLLGAAAGLLYAAAVWRAAVGWAGNRFEANPLRILHAVSDTTG